MAISDILISDINLLAGFPDQNFFTEPEMLTILNREMKLQIVPLLLKTNEDFFLVNKDYTITEGGSYRIPKRNLLNKLRDIKLYSSGSYTDLQRLFEEDRSSNRTGYYISRNSITLSDNITSGTLRVSYFLAPSELVLESATAKVLTIDSATQVTVEALPSTYSLTTTVDFVQSTQPYDILLLEQTITNISGTTLTFTSLPDDLAVGDYICLSGQSPVPLIPEELHPVLVQAALVTCLTTKKDEQASKEGKKLEQTLEIMSQVIDPRVESNDVKIKPQGLLSYIRRRR